MNINKREMQIETRNEVKKTKILYVYEHNKGYIKLLQCFNVLKYLPKHEAKEPNVQLISGYFELHRT